jgi:hypothetical protein
MIAGTLVVNKQMQNVRRFLRLKAIGIKSDPTLTELITSLAPSHWRSKFPSLTAFIGKNAENRFAYTT